MRTAAATAAALLLMASGPSLAQQQSAAAAADATYTPGGAKACLECHDEKSTLPILHTSHALRADSRTPFAKRDCEGCHGPSAKHSDKPRRFPTAMKFGRDSGNSAEEQNAVCLGCHESGKRMNWKASQHAAGDITCNSCHEIHTRQDPVQAKTSQPEVCYACHKEQRAQNMRFSHHPVREGKVVCSDCHNPHGSFTAKNLKKATVTETCYQCHQDKRGPFLWEHPPVREDCTLCHSPHGSTQPRMLKVRSPYLCQECHMANFHPSTAYDGSGVPPNGTAHQLLLGGCTNCHSRIHGSNHPSGVRFMR